MSTSSNDTNMGLDDRAASRETKDKMSILKRVDLPVYAVYGVGVAARIRRGAEARRRHATALRQQMASLDDWRCVEYLDVDGVEDRSRWNGTGKKRLKIQHMRGATETPTRGWLNSAGVVDAWFKLAPEP
ncbi:hypothetical protein TgHK011_007801 [Trichoderma gracile]|nr:hypothetical protein TgHK011_007801 [Trichoderma gracile]